MRQLTEEAQQAINILAQRYQFSSEAVLSLLQSIIKGNGSMAQFNHPEFGGSGQWMQSGMIMLNDMFNHSLKNRVAGLCTELVSLYTNQPNSLQSENFQSQQQSSQQNYGNYPQANSLKPMPTMSLFVPAGDSGHWWPDNLPAPTSTGSQNNARYAYFAGVRRLAIDVNGQVTLYDTLDHQITGFSQQQAVDGAITFTSQYGVVQVRSLPVISIDKNTVQTAAESQVIFATQTNANKSPIVNQETNKEASILETIEKLAGFKDKGILTDSEYNAKKAELLARL